MIKEINRWQVIIASTAILLVTGAVYAFSVFAGPLSHQTGMTMPQIMLAFTLNNAIGPIPMIFGGYLVDKGYVKWTIVLGALLFAGGFFLTGYANSPAMLYLTYGLIAGLDQGFAYSGALSNTIRLFPDKRGLASGILTAGMGFAAVIASPIASHLIQAHDAKFAFRAIGLAYIVIVLIAGIFIKPAPKNYKPAGWKPATNQQKAMENKTWKEMLKTPVFYPYHLYVLHRCLLRSYDCLSSSNHRTNYVWSISWNSSPLCHPLFNQQFKRTLHLGSCL